MIYGALQKHIDNLFALEDNFDKYDYIISVGKTLPGFTENKRIKENIMHGCQSTVWLIGEKSLTMNRQVGMMAMLEYMKRYEI